MHVERWLRRAVRMSPAAAALVTGVALGICWIAGNAAGGASSVPPHAFYIPILFAGIRFGPRGSLAVALLSTLLAGPMTWADSASRTPQPLLDWGLRGVYFVLIGQVLTTMVEVTTGGLRRELEDLRVAAGLWQAFDSGRFRAYFQPIVSMSADARISGAEALLRLEDPERGIVGPDEFIPLAEKTGLIRPIGEWVLRESCAQVGRWRDDGLIDDGFVLSVNVSAQQFDTDGFERIVSSALESAGLPASALQLEITETSLSREASRYVDALHHLRRIGVKLALDDFGTGHSTLTRIQRFPVDVLKIDRTFVATVGCSRHGSAIVENVLALADSLEAQVIAEGVETAEQAHALQAMGCDLAQGYHFGHPCTAEDFSLELATQAGPLRSPAPPVDSSPAADSRSAQSHI